MADSRETRQQELARLLLRKARQDLDLVMSVADTVTIADEIVGFHSGTIQNEKRARGV